MPKTADIAKTKALMAKPSSKLSDRQRLEIQSNACKL